jgi:hypothetical protein
MELAPIVAGRIIAFHDDPFQLGFGPMFRPNAATRLFTKC